MPFNHKICMKIITTHQTKIADLFSPIAVYLRLRNLYPKSMILEGTDFQGADDCQSFICCDPIAELVVNNGIVHLTLGATETEKREIAKGRGFQEEVQRFLAAFERSAETVPSGAMNGVFGYASWDAIEYMENLSLTKPRDEKVAIPEVRFIAYRFILAFNPLRNEVHIIENTIDGEPPNDKRAKFLNAAFEGPMKVGPFSTRGSEVSALSDEQYIELITRCKKHIARGDVFQIVPSRRFTQQFDGDEFQVYRALRSINRSPYLFYADFDGYRLFGSSPETQIVVKGRTAGISPIAGSTPRVGDDEVDRKSEEKLLSDPKESAEHCMLVDLARNDLSRNCKNVHVSNFRHIQRFSHVIHLASDVQGTLPHGGLAAQIASDTFPAGTLSGAPKHRAMQLLDEHEAMRRGHYGGMFGFFSFEGDATFAIMIRSFLSKNKTLVYQCGAGVVHDSVPELEVREVNAKLGALRAAIARAQELPEEV